MRTAGRGPRPSSIARRKKPASGRTFVTRESTFWIADFEPAGADDVIWPRRRDQFDTAPSGACGVAHQPADPGRRSYFSGCPAPSTLGGIGVGPGARMISVGSSTSCSKRFGPSVLAALRPPLSPSGGGAVAGRARDPRVAPGTVGLHHDPGHRPRTSNSPGPGERREGAAPGRAGTRRTIESSFAADRGFVQLHRGANMWICASYWSDQERWTMMSKISFAPSRFSATCSPMFGVVEVLDAHQARTPGGHAARRSHRPTPVDELWQTVASAGLPFVDGCRARGGDLGDRLDADADHRESAA